MTTKVRHCPRCGSKELLVEITVWLPINAELLSAAVEKAEFLWGPYSDCCCVMCDYEFKAKEAT